MLIFRRRGLQLPATSTTRKAPARDSPRQRFILIEFVGKHEREGRCSTCRHMPPNARAGGPSRFSLTLTDSFKVEVMLRAESGEAAVMLRQGNA
jgi:hypothetical protein